MPTQLELEDAAIEWIARLRATDVTDAERADFATWLARSDAHKNAFDAMAELWSLTGEIEDSAVVGPLTAEIESSPEARKKPRAWAPMAMAASLLMGVVGFLLFDGAPQYHTELGEQRRVVLDDGTTVHLNTRSTINVTYDDSQRQIELADGGEAFFEVARDTSRPFIVTTSHGNAQALGTAFNVHVTADSTRVAVAEGRVGVSTRQGNTATLKIAQQALIGDTVQLGSRTPANIAAWRSGRLIYDGVTLAALVADLNRYGPRPISLADASLGDMKVSAVLRLSEQDAMLDAIAESLDLRWTTVSDNLILLHAH